MTPGLGLMLLPPSLPVLKNLNGKPNPGSREAGTFRRHEYTVMLIECAGQSNLGKFPINLGSDIYLIYCAYCFWLNVSVVDPGQGSLAIGNRKLKASCGVDTAPNL